MKFSKSSVFAGLFLFVSTLTGCFSNTQRIANSPVQKVNEHNLTSKDFSVKLARKLKNYDALAAKDPTNVQRAKNEILREFLIKSLLVDWAKTNKISVSANEVETEINQLRTNYPDDLSFRRSLAKEGMSFSEWKDETEFRLLEKKVFQKINESVKPISNEEVKNFYETHKDRYQRKERIFIRQIVIDEQAKAEAIQAELKNKDFAELAKTYSITPEKSKGGEIGWIEKGTVDYFDPLFANSSGTKLIQSPFGFHIVKVEKKVGAETLSLETVRPQILSEIKAQREQAEYIAWLDTQLRSSKVYKDAELINSITVETKGSDE